MWNRLKKAWRNLAHIRAVDDELTDEIGSYRQMLEDEKVRAGADPVTARRQALIEMGGTELIKENVRDVRSGTTLSEIMAEFRQSWRGLRRNPSLTIVGTLMLALGIGATIVIFSIFYAVLMQPLPFRDVERVVQIWETRQHRGIDQASFSEANFWDVRSQNHSFEETAAYLYIEANLTGAGPAEKVSGVMITTGFLRTLGVSPSIGRDFTYDDDRDGANRVAIVGHKFWKARLGGDPGILGRTLRVNDKPYTVVGVLPHGSPWIDQQIYLPYGYRADADRGSWEFEVIGRLGRGVSVEAAQADLQRISSGLSQAYPKDDKGIGFLMRSSSTWIANDVTRRTLWVLLSAVGSLLLIACLNLANLLLARGAARQREIAVRAALGAGRSRLMRFVMMESIMLSGLGTSLGLALAWAALQIVRTLNINGVPRLEDATLNSWVVGFAVLIAIATGLLSGLAPALQAPVSGIATVLRDSDRQTGSRGQGRLRDILVTGEVALSFFLLVGAGLLIRSFTELTRVKHGFETENRLVFSLSMPGPYNENGVGKQFLDRFFERVRALPQVIDVGAVSHRPIEGGNPGMAIDSNPPRQGPGQGAAPPWAGWRVVSPGYFKAIGLPLVRGRVLNEGDPSVWVERGQPKPQRHVVISERLSKRLFGGQDPIGRHVSLWKGQSEGDAEVVGVVGDSRERGLASNLSLTVYLPYGRIGLPGEVVVHTRGNPLAIMPDVRSIVASLDPNLPIADVRSFDEVVQRSVAPQRFNTILLALFGGFALLLAMTGLYGVLAYSMSRRTSEIGLRVALGASRSNILGLTIAQGMRPASLGIVLGAIGASWLTRYAVTLLFGVKPFDLFTYCAVAILLLGTALLACYLPGLRAMRTDPVVALRTE